MTRKIVNPTSHPQYVAVEKMYMAFMALNNKMLIAKMSAFLSPEEIESLFLGTADDACESLGNLTLEQIDQLIDDSFQLR